MLVLPLAMAAQFQGCRLRYKDRVLGGSDKRCVDTATGHGCTNSRV